jgi:ribosomal protein L14
MEEKFMKRNDGDYFVEFLKSAGVLKLEEGDTLVVTIKEGTPQNAITHIASQVSSWLRENGFGGKVRVILNMEGIKFERFEAK